MTINAKYNVGDKVWILTKGKAKCYPVYKIGIEVYKDSIEIKYTLDITDKSLSIFDCTVVFEANVYSTKEELINSIIN